ncbi:MAG: hypothetical protein ACTSYN_01365, partial [Candidatus Heimdallarchaeaceae archaeon]
MRKSQILLAISLCLLVFLSSSFLLVFSQVHAQDEEEWDFEGVIRVKSDYVQVTTFDPKENGYNESVGDYSRPTLFTYVVGFDTDDDIRFDTYVAFYGFHMYDVSAYNYTTNKDLFKFVINSRWKLRIPKESPQHWQILYYPDPTYVQLAQNLAEKAPILFVNLTATVGCNLEYQIDFGRNATVGNFTTFGPGKPLVPSLPDFPGYNVSVPLFTDNIIIGANVKSDFFGGPIS